MPRKKTIGAAPRASKKSVKALESVWEEAKNPAEENNFSTGEAGFCPSPRFYRTIALTFLGVTLLLIIFVVFLTGGKAAVSLKLKPQIVKANANLTVAINPGKNQIVGLALGTIIKGEKTFSPSGGAEVLAPADGQVILYNRTKASQPLVATTRLLSPDNVLFRLKKSVIVPADGQITADVYADKFGKESEINPTKFIIPGLSEIKQKDIYAESKIKMSGGTKREAAVSEADIKEAADNLLAELYNLGQQELTQTSKTNGNLYLASLFTYTKNFIKTDAKIGAVADGFKVSGEVQVVGVFYNPMDLRNVLLEQVKENLADNQELSNNLTAPAIQIHKYDLAAKTAELRLAQEFLVRVNYSDNLLDKSKLLGRPEAEAMEYLKSLPWVDSIEIKLRPSWLRKLPAEASKIEIKVSE